MFQEVSAQHLKEEVLRVARMGRRRKVGCPTLSTSSASVSAASAVGSWRPPKSVRSGTDHVAGQ